MPTFVRGSRKRYGCDSVAINIAKTRGNFSRFSASIHDRLYLARYACLRNLFLCVLATAEPESCDGLDSIGNSSALQCDRSSDCLSLDCNATETSGDGAILHLFPCDNPPAIEIIFKSLLGQSSVGKFDSSNPSRTTGVPLAGDVEFQLTVSWVTTQTATITVCVPPYSVEYVYVTSKTIISRNNYGQK